MDGERVRNYWSNEIRALLDTYKQFETLVPAEGREGSKHPGEDGRYVETLIRTCLSRFLPKELEVLTGFILRPAVKTGKGRERSRDQDEASTQLDIIVYDTAHYPVYQRMGEYVIVPPEGVVGVISVKKTLALADVEKETAILANVGRICVRKNGKKEIRGPFLGLVGMQSSIEDGKIKTVGDKAFGKLNTVFSKKETNRYDWMPGYVGVLSSWSVCKGKPKEAQKAEYLLFRHGDEEMHMGLQMLLHHLLGVYYDRNGEEEGVGFTAFEAGRGCDKRLGFIEYLKVRGDRRM